MRPGYVRVLTVSTTDKGWFRMQTAQGGVCNQTPAPVPEIGVEVVFLKGNLKCLDLE